MTKTRDLSDFLIEGGADLPLGKPHIVPDVLYPAVSGNDLSGTALGGSYVYGTAHTDGRKYYYTDIKGSKPIKDPRIGAHFGSQRHRISSLQLLEQETTTHGKDVFSIDGRDWLRVVGGTITGNDARGSHIIFKNGSNAPDGDFLEITGYFNKLNYLAFNEASRMGLNYQVNGGSATQTNDTQFTAVTSPLDGRYVNPMAVHTINIGTITEPGIYTVKLVPNTTTAAAHHQVTGIELIAQDTSNRNNIQIPSQNVVSFGKKFTVSGTPHYDPFNGFTSGSSVSSYVDTATSLGLDKWLHSSNYYRPYNGGRVVKWVDSSGVIKTSVTMMPPNAKSLKNADISKKANASVANNTYLPTFEAHTTDVNEDNLHEEAKTFHVREFGNGSANGGTGATWADASMVTVTANQDVAFVMDDGLTSFSADNIYTPSSIVESSSIMAYNPNDHWYVTFIGTGVTTTQPGGDKYTMAQNLPFGTHIMKAIRGSDSPSTVLPDYYIDGVELDQVTENFARLKEITFHQPKRPPIPEDACVLADYMLMADTVSVSGSVDINSHISKGVRRISASRDFFYNASSGTPSLTINPGYPSGIIQSHSGSINGGICKVPYFGTNYQPISMSGKYSTVDKGGSTDVSVTEIGSTSPLLLTSSVHTLGLFDGQTDKTSSGDFFNFGAEIATPIHTSHHYQAFETPFLYELVGGDRNMEQTNLVCSPDGKTWDEVTRDTSYMGVDGFLIREPQDTNGTSVSSLVYTEYRGIFYMADLFNKNFAIAYDRMICLKDGLYEVSSVGIDNISGATQIKLNGSDVISGHYTGQSWSNNYIGIIINMKRGDYIQPTGTHSEHFNYSRFQCIKIK